MVEFILSLISVEAITALPWHTQLPGILLIAFFFWRGAKSLISLRLIRAASSFFMMVVIAVVLSRFGSAIAMMIENQQTPPAS